MSHHASELRSSICAQDDACDKPVWPQVDVWAAGVLAYELVVGRAPFEVKDESQTASMIMFSNNIHFPPQYSPTWADFVRTVLPPPCPLHTVP